MAGAGALAQAQATGFQQTKATILMLVMVQTRPMLVMLEEAMAL